MATYNGDWLDDVVDTNPADSDPVSEGAAAMREVRKVLKNIFPSAGQSGDEYTGTFADLNQLVASSVIPNGTITMWAGTLAEIPEYWRLCDGTNGTPNMVGRFPIGAIHGVVPPNFQGGNTELSITGDTESHALTVAEMPAHAHQIGAKKASGSVQAGGTQTHFEQVADDTSSTGGGGSHSHGVDITVPSNEFYPLWTSVHYIMKVATP